MTFDSFTIKTVGDRVMSQWKIFYFLINGDLQLGWFSVRKYPDFTAKILAESFR